MSEIKYPSTLGIVDKVSAVCARCEQYFPDQILLFLYGRDSDGFLYVRFLCPSCAEGQEYIDVEKLGLNIEEAVKQWGELEDLNIDKGIYKELESGAIIKI